MRALIFVLVLGNLLFLAWTQGYLGSTTSPDAVRIGQQLQPERMRIVARGEPPPSEKKAVAEKKEAIVCLLWHGLAGEDADRIERLLAEKFAAFKTVRSQPASHTNYWVFIPAQASKQDADRKAAELKKLGVPEYFIVQDAGPHRLAISLGIFSTEAAAYERLEALRTKGVRSARVGERNAETARASLEASGPETQVEAVRAAVAGVASDTAAACPETRP